MTFFEVRMIEVFGRQACHSQTLHDSLRAVVCRNGHRDDLRKLQFVKREIERRSGGFRREAFSPVIAGQPPADLNAGCEVGIKPGHSQSDESNEVGDPGNFDRPQAETMTFEMFADASR